MGVSVRACMLFEVKESMLFGLKKNGEVKGRALSNTSTCEEVELRLH